MLRKASTDWQCIKRGKNSRCPATVKEQDGSFTPGPSGHIHPPEPGVNIALKITCEVRQKATENVFVTASNIADDALLTHSDTVAPEASRPAPANLVRMVNRRRQQLRPDHPSDLDFELDESFIPPDFVKKDATVEGQRHLIFATDHQLYILSKAKTWYLDATFKVVRKPFYHLFSIHAFIRSGDSMKQEPLAFCLMSRRRKVDYKKVLRAVVRALPAQPCVQAMVADFEAAIWSAVAEVFPTVIMRGCAFHFAQAIYRKVCEFGLQSSYRQNGDVQLFIRQVMAINFLPAEHIVPAYRYLKKKTSNHLLIQLLQYMKETWLLSSVWPLESWSVFQQPIRTNNDVEGWHRRLHVKSNDTTPCLYVLIEILHKEASLLPLHGKLVAEGKLTRRYRASSEFVQNKLFSLWDQYDSDILTTKQLLVACSKLCGV